MKTGIIIVSLALLVHHYSFAQSQQDPDWPCIQVLVPKISAASIWDGPSVEKPDNDEIFQEHSAALVFAVVERHEPLTEPQLDEYIARFETDQQNMALTVLFKSFLDSFNAKRHQQIVTIKRYTKSQVKSARAIENLMNQKDDLQTQQGGQDKLQEIESKLHWQKRMFKEREQSLHYLCELPQEIAQQAGEVARAIAAKLNY